jgi:hypothetical protein
MSQSNFYELWKITGAGSLVGLKRGDILTVGGSVGSYTFQVPNTTPYQTRDTDYIWFQNGGNQRTVTNAEIIGYDFPRTIVYYSDTSPYTIEYIGILDTGQSVNNKMRDDFHLSIWWDNTLSLHGARKVNRTIGQLVWAMPTLPTNLALTLISGGVKIDWTCDSINQTEIWGKNDSDTYALLYTIAAGTKTKSEAINPVDLRYYKIRALDGSGNYSLFTAEQSIAMLGAEVITNGTFDTDTGWTYNPAYGWSISGGKANWAAGGYNAYGLAQTDAFTAGDWYRVKFTISNNAGTIKTLVGQGDTYNLFKAPLSGYMDFPAGDYIYYVQVDIHNTTGIKVFQSYTTGGAAFKLDNLSMKKILMH